MCSRCSLRVASGAGRGVHRVAADVPAASRPGRDVFRDSKHGAALRHLPSAHREVNLAWMWGALLAATTAGWLHHLTATTAGDGTLAGHGVRAGQAMIATLRWRLVRVPGRMIRHARGLTLRLPPGRQFLAEILARLRACPPT